MEYLGKLGNNAVYRIKWDEVNKMERNEKIYWILDRMIVRWESGEFWKVGEYNEKTNAVSFNENMRRKIGVEKVKVKVKEEIEEREEIIGDVYEELEIDKVLKSVREMSVDKLLEGFNYGL